MTAFSGRRPGVQKEHRRRTIVAQTCGFLILWLETVQRKPDIEGSPDARVSSGVDEGAGMNSEYAHSEINAGVDMSPFMGVDARPVGEAVRRGVVRSKKVLPEKVVGLLAKRPLVTAAVFMVAGAVAANAVSALVSRKARPEPRTAPAPQNPKAGRRR
ncbi:MAG: hypothetical protein KGS00_12340 [Alphaproteobacteria bacterium]|nr:hypothetical protein [Alphaproteobacteria bacterium]